MNVQARVRVRVRVRVRPNGLGSVSCLPAAIAMLFGCGCGSTKPQDVDDDLPALPVAGPAPTPPMGWNSWNAFAGNVSGPLMELMADAMVTSGMASAGYQFVTIDDTWSTKSPTLVRGADEPLVPDVRKFPDGIATIAEHVHGQGLKLGIHADRGVLTCSYYPGSEGHEQQDATTFAGWGVDFVKYDNCPPAPVPTPEMLRLAYTAMGDALVSTGRPIVYSLCAWSFYEWGVGLGSLWRTTGDIRATWESVLGVLTSNIAFAPYAGPNGWNDPDMLEVGNFPLGDSGETEQILAEYRSHFTLWAISAAPLITGNDLVHMSEAVKQILTNAEVIALDQDVLGYQGVPVRAGDLSVWAKPLNESGARGVVLFNAGDSPTNITVAFADVGLGAGRATVRDLWAHADRGSFVDGYTATVAPHDVVALRVKGTEPARPPAGNVFLSDLPWIYAANGLGPIEKDRSNGASASGDGGSLSIRGSTHAKGLGVAGPASVVYRLNRACTAFTATVGIDDQASGSGTAVFQVWADGEKLFDSGVMTGTSDALPVSVDVTGRRRLKLLVTNGGDGTSFDYGDWGDARVDCQ